MIREFSIPKGRGIFAFGVVAVVAVGSVYWLGSGSSDVDAWADTQTAMGQEERPWDHTVTVAIPIGAPVFELYVPHLEGGTLTVSEPTATSFPGTTATTERRVEGGIERTSTIFITASPSEFAIWSTEQAQLLAEDIGSSGAGQQILDSLKRAEIDAGIVAESRVDLDGRVIEVRMMHNGAAAFSSWNEVVENSPTNQWPQSLLTAITS